MQIFYAPDITGDSYTLNEKESKHSIRVLRMKIGAIVRLIDGNGNLFLGEIADPDPVKCVIRINSVINNFEKRIYRLHIAISPLKNPDRFEWFIEKSVEIGIDEITPLICMHSEKTGIKAQRINNLIISAMKQSLKAKITHLNNPCQFNDFINADRAGNLIIAHCNERLARRKLSEVYSRGNEVVILVGPEGDFSEEEINLAADRGYKAVHLGSSRLRTETAGIAACHSVYFINQ